MSSDDEVYVMAEEDEEGEWVSPVPVRRAISETVGEQTDVDAADLDLDEYVDWDELRAVLDGNSEDTAEFDLEDLTVTVDASGEIAIE